MTREYSPTDKQIEAILAFAIKHRCVINPYGWKRYLEGYNRKGHCICDKERLQCPCAEAPDEIKQKARCLCGLFWSSYEAYSIAKSIRGAAVGISYAADKDDLNREAVITRPRKIEALLDFGKSAEDQPPTIQRFVESAVRLISVSTGIDLEPGTRMIMSRNEDGTLSLDVSYNLSLTKPAGKDSRG